MNLNVPGWLEGEIRYTGERRLAGELSRQEAITELRDKITEKADRQLINGILDAFSGKVLDAWHRSHRHPAAPGPLAGLQSELFPELPARLYIAPSQAKALMLCDGHDWDMARNVLANRTRHAIEGARQDWDEFDAAYQKVRPLLTGDLTTAEVAPDLLSDGPAAAQTQ